MKTSIFIFCAVLTVFGLTAFGYMNWSDAVTDQEKPACSKTVFFENDFPYLINEQAYIDLFYNVDSRFMTTITKENLQNAKSIIDILPRKATKSVESYQIVEVCILLDDKKISETGDDATLNAAQLKLLQSADYSTNFYISSSCKSRNAVTGELVKDTIIYYMTIIPEREAEYTNGPDALIEYLKRNSKEQTAIIKEDQLQPGKVNFTVTKKGTIANVKLTSTSGYPSIDETLVGLITNIPGKWNPATNSKGEKVDQELVFFFGLEGC